MISQLSNSYCTHKKGYVKLSTIVIALNLLTIRNVNLWEKKYEEILKGGSLKKKHNNNSVVT